MADEPTVTPQGSLIETGSFAALVLQAAQHPDSAWRMEGSGNWPEKPGRLTVWVDLDEAAWDEVFDRLNELYDENGVRRGLAADSDSDQEQVFRSEIAICGENGGGGNRTRVTSHPEARDMQDVSVSRSSDEPRPRLCNTARRVSVGRTTASVNTAGAALSSAQEVPHPSVRAHSGDDRGRDLSRPRRSFRNPHTAADVRRGGALRPLRLALHLEAPAPRRQAGVRALAARLLAHLEDLRERRGRLVDGEQLRRRDAVHARHLEQRGALVGRIGAVRELELGDRAAAAAHTDPRRVLRGDAPRQLGRLAEHREGVRAALRPVW